MKNSIVMTLLLLSVTASCLADVYIYNTTDERMTYQVQLPNGDTKDGVIKEYNGYYPAQTTVRTKDDGITAVKVTGESGTPSVELKTQDTGIYLIGKKNESLTVKPVSWSLNNGQNHKRELTIYNATGTTQSFALIDEKEMRNITLEPGEETTLPAKNGFNGSSGFHHLKWADGHRLDSAIKAGYFTIIYNDKRDPGKVQAENYGHLTPPRGVKVP